MIAHSLDQVNGLANDATLVATVSANADLAFVCFLLPSLIADSTCLEPAVPSSYNFWVCAEPTLSKIETLELSYPYFAYFVAPFVNSDGAAPKTKAALETSSATALGAEAKVVI